MTSPRVMTGDQYEVESFSLRAGCHLRVWTSVDYQAGGRRQHTFSAGSRNRHETLERLVGAEYLEENVRMAQCICYVRI